jgi:hypothetical protein
MSVAFLVAGASMMLHHFLGAFVFKRLDDEPDLRDELFRQPNAWLGTPKTIGMLRIKYFWPFVKTPESVTELVDSVRWSLALTRVFGFLFATAAPLFLVAAVATAVAI